MVALENENSYILVQVCLLKSTGEKRLGFGEWLFICFVLTFEYITNTVLVRRDALSALTILKCFTCPLISNITQHPNYILTLKI